MEGALNDVAASGEGDSARVEIATNGAPKHNEPQAVAGRREDGTASALCEEAKPEYEAVPCADGRRESGPHAREAAPEVEQAAPLAGTTADARGERQVGALAESAEVVLELEASSPGQVRFMGQSFFLSVLPYRLLLHLARNPRRVVPYGELDEVMWPDAKVEQQQILAHKATVVRRFRGVCGEERANRLLRTIAGHGLYLDLAPEAIRLGGRPGDESPNGVANPIAERVARL